MIPKNWIHICWTFANFIRDFKVYVLNNPNGINPNLERPALEIFCEHTQGQF